jgi:hypothetical protein
MQFKHPEILYFLFLLIVPLLVHLFQFRRFKKSISLTFDSSQHFLCRPESQNKKKMVATADYYCYPYYRFCATLFCSKDKENATNEMYIIWIIHLYAG